MQRGYQYQITLNICPECIARRTKQKLATRRFRRKEKKRVQRKQK